MVALRRVTEKQRVDLEKMKKGVPPPPAPPTSMAPGGPEDASQQVLRVQAATAWGEVTRLKAKLASLEGGGASGAAGSAAAESLRKALKVAESEIKTLRSRLTATATDSAIVENLRNARETAEAELGALRASSGEIERKLEDTTWKLEQAEERVKALEDAAGKPVKVYDMVTGKQATAKVDAVALSFAEKREALSTSQVAPLAPTSDTYAGMSARCTALEKENADLRHELEAFDLGFFEEIEDLKFKCVCVHPCAGTGPSLPASPPPPLSLPHLLSLPPTQHTYTRTYTTYTIQFSLF